MTAIRLFFKWASSRGLYPNISENLKGAKISREHKKDYLTSKQTRRLLSTIDANTLQGKRDYAIVSLMVTAGLRDTEVSNADLKDLRTVGDFTALFVLGKGKDEKADYVKIVDQVESAIRDYLKELGNIKPDSPLFISLSNNSYGNRLTTRSISRICKKALVAAGYDSDRISSSQSETYRSNIISPGRKVTAGSSTICQTQQYSNYTDICS